MQRIRYPVEHAKRRMVRVSRLLFKRVSLFFNIGIPEDFFQWLEVVYYLDSFRQL